MSNPIQKTKTVYFSTSAQIVRRLGRESVSDPIIAVLELVKNSYDADANFCKISFDNIKLKKGEKIIIKDDGHGMKEEDILHNWLRAATDNKSIEKITKKYKRRKIGEKGIGRFATERLARKVTLISNPEKSDQGYILEVDWSKYDDPNADFEKVPLPLQTFSKVKSDHGLEIILEGLSEQWDEDKLNKLKRDISLIIPPSFKGSKFNVNIQAEEFPKFDGKLKSSFLNDADFTFYGSLEKDGKVTYKLKSRYGKKIERKEKLGNLLCGPIEFQLFFFYLGKTEYLSPNDQEKIDFTIRKKIMADFSGIKMYRDNFRVKPFGDPKNDWLDLDKERINSPGLYPGNNQVFGVVRITKDSNPNIEDTTSRENIVTNLAWNDLKNFIKGSLRYFSLERQKLEKKYKGRVRSSKKSVEKKENLIKTSFKEIKKEALAENKIEEPRVSPIPQDIINACPNNLKQELNEFNGCLVNNYFNAAAILARKILEIACIIKLKKEKKENLIRTDLEYSELPAIIEVLKKENLIDSKIASRLVKHNNIKLFGDSAAHSFRTQIHQEDIGPIRDLLRICLEQLFSNNH